MKKYSMITDQPGRSLFFFAVPMILGNLFQQLYTTADSVIVGRFVGEEALAAVGASYSLTTVFVMIAIGGGMGASVVTAQYLGAGMLQKLKTSISTALISFFLLSFLLGAFGFFFSHRILTALSTPDDILKDAVLYLDIYFVGLPFLFLYNILSSVFNALGDSKTPLYLLIFSSFLNILTDLFLVGGMKMGVAGAAVATVFSQGLSAVISLLLLRRAMRGFQAQEEKGRLYDPAMLKGMITVAIPSMLQQSIVSIGMLLVQSVVNGFGSSVLAGYTAGMRIESVCIVPMIAVGNAMSTFSAQNLGAGAPDRVKKGYHAAVRLVVSFAIVICVLLTLFHRQIIAAFLEAESERAAFDTGNAYLSFIAFFFVMIGLKAITDGVLRGAGDVFVFTLANLANLSIRVAFAFLFAQKLDVAAVWYAVPLGWTANFLISFCRYATGKWSRKQLIKVEEE
mgnify:FL=1